MIGSQHKENNSLEKTEPADYSANEEQLANNTAKTSFAYGLSEVAREWKDYMYMFMGAAGGFNLVLPRLSNHDYFVDAVEGFHFSNGVCAHIKLAVVTIIGANIGLIVGNAFYHSIANKSPAPSKDNDALIDNSETLIEDLSGLDLNNTCPVDYIYN